MRSQGSRRIWATAVASYAVRAAGGGGPVFHKNGNDTGPCPRNPYPIPESRIGLLGLSRMPVLLEQHRADVRQRGVQPGAVVPEYPGDASSLAWRRVTKRCPCSRSTFNEPNRVSLQALSPQLPLRLIEAVMPHWASTSLKSSLAYWLPRSLWKISPACLRGWRLNQAMRTASMTMSRVMSWRSDQPTTWRLNRSITTASNSQPSSVAM